jgi:hypothetical protein
VSLYWAPRNLLNYTKDARKRNKKAANAKLNKSRIYIGDILDGNKDCFLSGNEL